MEKNKTSRKFLTTALVAIMVISILVAFASSTELTQLTDTTRSTKTVEVRQGTVDIDKSVNVDKSVKNVTVKQGTKDVDKSNNEPVKVEHGTNVDVDKSVKNVTVKQGTKDVDKSNNEPVKVEHGRKDVDKSNKTAKSPGCEDSFIYNTYISNGEDVDGDGCLESFYLEIDADAPGESYCDVNAYIEASTGESWWTTCWTIYDGSTSDNAFIYFDASEFAISGCEEVTLTVYLYTCDGEYTGSSDTVSVLLEGQGCEDSFIYNTWISNGEDVDGDGCLESFDLEIDADTPGEFYCDVNAYIEASTGESWWATCWTIYDGSTSDNAFIYFDACDFATTTECEEVTLTVYLYTCDGEYTGSSDTVSVLLDGQGCEDSFIYNTCISNGEDVDGDGCLDAFDLQIDADTPGEFYCDVKVYIEASTGESWWTTCWTIYDGYTSDNAFIYFDASDFATTTDCEEVTLTVYLYTCDGEYTGSSDTVSVLLECDEYPDGQTDYWAVIVGVADYEGTAHDLEYTDDDAIDLYNTLLLSDDYWQADHIMLLLDSEADRAGILTAFDWLDSNEDPDDVVLFFFSGHGTYDVDDDGDELDGWDEFFCPYDFNNIRDDELDAELDKLGSTSIAVIMDTCFAGGMTKDSSVKTLPKEKVELIDGFVKDIGETGRVVLMACDDDEVSWETGVLENGVFSYYVIEGLEGCADAEGNGDSICSAEETFVYAEPRVVAWPPTTQHPQLYDEYPGELPITTPCPCGNMGVDPTDWSPTPNCGESDSQIVTVSATGGTVEGVTVSKVSGPTWLSVSPTNLGDIASGSSKTFTMTAAPPSETSGDFPYTITVSNTCGTPSSGDVTGTITVYCPELAYSPATHDFGDKCEGETDSTTFEIWNSGTGTLTYFFSETCGWVEVNPTSGSSTGEHDTITVDIDTTGLSEGLHTCDITINSNDGSGTFTVTVTVVPCPKLSYSPVSHDFGDKCEGETDSTTFEIWNCGDCTLTYSVSESCDWVNVNPTSGSSTGEHDTITVNIDTTGLSEGLHTCDITISSNGGSGTFTVTVTVVLCGNMGVNPTSWNTTINSGGSDNEIVTVSASGGIVEGVTVSKISGPTWLSVSSTDLGDIASGSSKTFTMTASPPAGTSGDFTYTVRVSNTCGNPSTRDVSGTITVHPENENDWGVRLDVTCGAGTDVAEFGLNEAATDGFDAEFDMPEPPAPPPPYQQAYFYYPENPLVTKLSTSYIPSHSPECNSWPFRVDYNGEPSDVTITWNADDIAAVPVDTPLFFVADSERINMRTTPSYTFSATTGTYEFEITTYPVCEYTFELFTGWNMISFPLEPLDKDPETIFGPDYYCLYTWDPVSGSYVSVGEVAANRGYWLLVLEDRSVTVEGDCIYEYCTSLIQGWNMIGSVFYTTTVPDGTETDPADQMYPNLYAWSVDHYVLTQDIEPGVGYWALAYSDCGLCVFPAPPPPPPSSTQQLQSRQIPRGENDWSVRLDVTCGAGTDVAEFGLNEAATDGFDPEFDLPEPPPPPPPYQQAYFYYPENPLVKKLSTSYIPSHPEGNSWHFQLDYNGEPSDVTITWNAADIAAVPADCSLLFVVDSVEIDMLTTPTYTFSATTGTYEFEIRAITGGEKPDLIITEKWLCWPDNCTICYNVTNIGDGTAPAGHNTALYVDSVVVAHDHVPVDLAPGESYIGCFDDYTWTYTPPSEDIKVCADNSETLDELDEDNNCLTNIWMCGDVNGDHAVNVIDVVLIYKRALDPGYPLDLPWAGDVNCDRNINVIDVVMVYKRALDPGYDLDCCCEVV